MNIKDRIGKISGVLATEWNANEMKLRVHYAKGIDVGTLKLRVLKSVDDANLQQAIGKYEFIQSEKRKKK